MQIRNHSFDNEEDAVFFFFRRLRRVHANRQRTVQERSGPNKRLRFGLRNFPNAKKEHLPLVSRAIRVLRNLQKRLQFQFGEKPLVSQENFQKVLMNSSDQCNSGLGNSSVLCELITFEALSLLLFVVDEGEKNHV